MPLLSSRFVSRRFFVSGGVALTISLMRPAMAQTPASRPAATRQHVLRASRGDALLRGAKKERTAVWCYDGVIPGPTLRARRGREMSVRLVNELPEPTTIHWHGIRLANAMDGTPYLNQPPVDSGAGFDYVFTPPDAGTFWYHPSQFFSVQLERGLCGALIVEEDAPIDVDRDIILICDDWRLTVDGVIDEANLPATPGVIPGGIGEHFTVNGSPAPDIAVRTNERLRLRIINAAHARVMSLRLERHSVTVVAFDGQPADPFVARDSRVLLAPGNRVDLFVDTALAPGSTAALILEENSRDITMARLAYESSDMVRPRRRDDIGPLPANPLPQRMDFRNALRIDHSLGDSLAAVSPVWARIGKADDRLGGRPLFSVKRGRTVMLALPNRTTRHYAMHVHGHHFRLLDNLDDGWKPYWLDTVLIPARATARVAFVADNPGKWMIYCQPIESHASGMAAWFEVA